MDNEIQLSELRNGSFAFTEAYGSSLEEACIICLDDQGHDPGVIMEVDGVGKLKYQLYWQKEITNQMSRCWRDSTFTTEQAAYGIAFLLIPRVTDYSAIERAVKGTGFDYWLGSNHDNDAFLFHKKARLEVSGIRNGGDSEIKKRVKRKINQTNLSDATRLPAFVVIVEFSQPVSYIGEKQ